MRRSEPSKPSVLIGAVLVLMAASSACQNAPSPLSATSGAELLVLSGTASVGTVPLTSTYRVLVEESFTTETRSTAPGFVLERAGAYGHVDGEPWIIGGADGSQPYAQFYRTDPGLLRIKPDTDYLLEFDYEVIEEPDRGFEAIFYSPVGGSRNDWLPGVVIEGPPGTGGRASLEVRTGGYDDYRVVWNVVGDGAIAIRNISVSEVSAGSVVAEDPGSLVARGPGPAFAFAGTWSMDSTRAGEPQLLLTGPAAVSTNPDVADLPSDTPVMIEFAYTLLNRTEEIGRAFVGVDGRDEVRMGVRLDGLCPESGVFTGGGLTGAPDLPYTVRFERWDGAAIALRELRVLVQEPVEPHQATDPADLLADVPFPRLGTYQLGMPEWIAENGAGTAVGPDPWMSIAEFERRLALFDVVAGMSEFTTSEDPAFVRRIRRANPDILLLPYTIAQEQSWHEPPDVDRLFPSAFDAYRAGLDDRWWLRTTNGRILEEHDWPGIRILNASPYCPPDDSGRVYLDYFVDRAVDIHLAHGTWNGLFVDNLFARANPHLPNAFDQSRIDADYNGDGRRDETIPWIHEMTAEASALQMDHLRRRLGDRGLIIANSWAIPDRSLAPHVNGFTFENYNFPWYPESKVAPFSEVGWCHSLAVYRQLQETCRPPVVLLLHATGLHTEFVTASRSYRDPTQDDIRIQRLAFATALLGDGYYDYDLFDSRSAPVLFDEWLVDESGATVATEEGKGWLGRALGLATELVSGEETVVELDRPVELTSALSDDFRVGDTRLSGDEPRQVIIEFDWEVKRTLALPLGLRAVHGNTVDQIWIKDPVAGAWGSERIHVTWQPGESGYFEFDRPETGALILSNVRVAIADAGVFVREFERGVVVVNATLEPATMLLNRSGLRRIAGVLDPETNNGLPVSGVVRVPAADAAVLFAR